MQAQPARRLNRKTLGANKYRYWVYTLVIVLLFGEGTMKINNRKLLLIAVLSISGFWLNSCQGLSKQNVALTPTSSLTHTNSPTQILTLTSTSTVTPTITISPTITSTFTTTPAYTLPGLYYFYKCVDFIPKGINLTINFCVQSVKVNTDLTMRFNVYWKTYYEIGNHLIKKGHRKR